VSSITGPASSVPSRRWLLAAAGSRVAIVADAAVAVVQLEHAELLAASDRAEAGQPLLAEAREIFEQLRATPWLERVDALGVGAATAA
jgi:hypothetical protein